MKFSKTGKSLILVTQIGITMIVAIFVGLFIGLFLDKIFKQSFFAVIFLFFGIAAAFRNAYYITKKFYVKDMLKEEKEMEYFETLKRGEDISDIERERLLGKNNTAPQVTHTVCVPKVKRSFSKDDFNTKDD